MQQQLNLVQVFLMARAFLGKQYFDHYLNDLCSCAGDLIINKCKENWQQEPETWDPAVWDDWMNAANYVLRPELASPKDTLVTELQGYYIMQKYIHDYGYRLDSAELIELARQLDSTGVESFQSSQLWKDWLLCFNAMIDGRLSSNGLILSIDTYITQQQSFETMQKFLKNYCVKTTDIQDTAWFDHINGLRIEDNIKDPVLNDWFHSYDYFVQNHANQLNVTAIQAFNVMRLFVIKQQESSNLRDLVALSKTLEVQDKRPKQSSVEYDWMHAAYAIFFK